MAKCSKTQLVIVSL